MRFVTYRSGKESRPAMEVDGGALLDLATAFSHAIAHGFIKDTLEVPKDITGVIAGGPALADACRTILREAQTGALSEAQIPIGSVSLMAPIPRPAKNVFCVGSNYRAHVTESSRAQKKEDKVPKRPVFFTKPPTAVVGPGDTIRLDPAVSDKMDYEVELGVVIGKPGRNIKAVDVLDHIFGFTIINDVTARDLQRAHGGQFLKGKGLDTCCPMGPQIVTLDELPNFENLRISMKVNGELRQDGSTGDLIFPIAHLLEQLSEGLTLEPGDLLATGTPSGVGYAMDPPQFLKNGDILTCEIEGIGQLTNSVRDVSKEGLAA